MPPRATVPYLRNELWYYRLNSRVKRDSRVSKNRLANNLFEFIQSDLIIQSHVLVATVNRCQPGVFHAVKIFTGSVFFFNSGKAFIIENSYYQ